MAGNIELVVLSFLASLGFAIVFQVAKKDLLLAGLGGGLTRIFYLIFIAIIPSRIVYVALAAMVAALYAEIVSGMKHVPATYFMYPTIIPLIPGDLFYYTCAGIITGNAEMFRTNAINLILALGGLTVGLVVCSFVSNIMRIRRLATIAGKSDEEY